MDQRKQGGEGEKEATQEITLRPSELSVLDDRIMRVYRGHACATREDGLSYLNGLILLHPWCLAICVGGRPVGSVSVSPAPGTGVHRVSIGCALAYAYWGCGIAMAAVFEEWPQLAGF